MELIQYSVNLAERPTHRQTNEQASTLSHNRLLGCR